MLTPEARRPYEFEKLHVVTSSSMMIAETTTPGRPAMRRTGGYAIAQRYEETEFRLTLARNVAQALQTRPLTHHASS